jgi:hypothetical protein
LIEFRKLQGKKIKPKNIDLINRTNRAAACLVEYVNQTGDRENKFKTLKELKKFMADEAEKQKEDNDGESSEEDEEDKICFSKQFCFGKTRSKNSHKYFFFP